MKPTSIWEAYLSQIMAEKAHVTSVHDVTGCFVSLQMTVFFLGSHLTSKIWSFNLVKMLKLESD